MNRRWLPILVATAAFVNGGPAGAAMPGAPVAHRLFGLLQSARGPALTLRLRSGRLLVVDATAAFAHNRVSEPLFSGKSTVVEGSFGPRGLFYATAVKRAAPRPSSWGADQ
jgi:hypothetical protein